MSQMRKAIGRGTAITRALWTSVVRVVWNPVLRRDVISGLRSSRLRWIMACYVAVPFGVMIVAWPSGEVYYGGGGLAQEIWKCFIGSQVLQLLLLVPVFAAYSVSSEFERRTADFLWTSSIPPWLLVLSKLFGVFLLSTLLLLSSLAALSTVFFLGGVDTSEMLIGYGALACVAFFAAAVAVYFSAVMRNGHVALFCSYTVCAIVGAMVAASSPQTDGYLVPMIVLVPSIFFTVLACRAGYRPVGEKQRTHTRLIDDPARLRKRRCSWPFYLLDPQRRSPPIPDDRPVVSEHEMRLHPFLRTSWRYRCTYLMAMVCCILLVYSLGDIEASDTLWWASLMIATSWTVVLHGVSLTMDQEMQMLDSIRLTPIRPQQYLQGKLGASIRTRWLLHSFALLSLVTLHLVHEGSLLDMLFSVVSWFLLVECFGMIALAIAGFCSRTMLAISTSVGTVVVIMALWAWATEADTLREWIGPQKLRASLLMTLALVSIASWRLANWGVERKWSLEKA